MAVYVIADLHLSLGTDKKMDVFGEVWKNYEKRIKKNWKAIVKPDDIVILPGDISWALGQDESIKDFAYINALPGIKYISKGNHDYWWTTLKKMKKFCRQNGLDSINFLNNNCLETEKYVICATRGWMIEKPGIKYTAHDKKIFQRELLRLRASLDSRPKNTDKSKKLVVALHYPPFDFYGGESEFCDILKEYKVSICVYGHLHGDRIKTARQGKIKGIEYKLVSADALDFTPIEL
jgi:predicted phosphohydrolase